MVSLKYFCVVLVFVQLLSFFTAVEETGNLQITCKSGIRIYFDNQVAGMTTEQNMGLLLHGISPGIHKVRGENAEFIPSEFEVNIRSGETKQIKIGKDGAPMVLIPAGDFQMGTNDGSDDEKPEHTVYLDAFYIDKYEVTNAQYKKFVQATGHFVPVGFEIVEQENGYIIDGGFKPWSDPNFDDDNQPVIGVSWEDARAYADWADKRLPTEAEWEKAARGGLAGKKYVWGDELPPPAGAGNFGDVSFGIVFPMYRGRDLMNGYKDNYVYPAPVGRFSPNGYGLYDMAGNVWEWCADCYNKEYYTASPEANPKGADSGDYHVYRGGSWHSALPYLLRVAYRGSYHAPANWFYNEGFRCAD